MWPQPPTATMPSHVAKNRYISFGRIHPERADVSFQRIDLVLEGGGHVIAHCHSSQLTVEVDAPHIDGFIAAHILAENAAEIVVGALGFSLGSGYSIELIQTVDADGTPHVFGVRPTGDDGATLGFDPHIPIFNRAFRLAGTDVFFRMALLDFLRAIPQARDCAMYCYRAIESIRSAFAFSTKTEGWSTMHATLGTDRAAIDQTVKAYADPVRHGNWINTPPTDKFTRWRMLRLTRDILAKYLDYAAPAT